jgi:uncharacterized delta-60 repeat protein
MRGVERAPRTQHDEIQGRGWRDYLLRQLYPPAVFDPFAEPAIHFPERMANDLNQAKPFHATRSISPAQPPAAFDGVQEAWVNHFSSGLAPGVEYASAIALDHAGNVYVTGSSLNPPFKYDYLTAKYAPTGALLWTARYNGDGHGDDHAVAIGVDATGNVYVTGSSQTLEASTAFVTIKYNADGAQQWIANFDRRGGSCYPDAMVVEQLGNVYVTGRNHLGGSSECLTIKYNANGVEQWIAEYKAQLFNFPRTLALDPEGNVLVAGHCYDQDERADDFLTIKYNAGGVEQWATRYNGSAYSDDLVTAMAVDDMGNVYVMGERRGNDDYAIVKYDGAGAQQWVASLGRGSSKSLTASALAVDGLGNLYAAGAAVEGHDYTTIKYNPNGETLWVARYDNPVDDGSGVVDLALDRQGNVLVTGFTSGAETWRDYTTVKYDAIGVQQWVARYNGSKNSYDYAVDLAIDAAGNIYVTGSSEAIGTGQDYTTIKYNAAGQEQWVARYNKEGNSNDAVSGITIDAAGNAYITGSSETANGHDYVTIKYNNAGNREWMAHYDGSAHDDDVAAAVAVDEAGNVYVTGSSNEAGTGGLALDYTTIKYNAAGIQQWVAHYNGPGYSRDIASALVIDRLGNVYVTGSTAGLHPEKGYFLTEDYATVKYNADGTEQWVAKYDGPRSEYQFDGATAIAVDGVGNVYVTGRSEPNSYATVKYNANGLQQWIARYDAGAGYPAPVGLLLDGKGNLYLAGAEHREEQRRFDYAVIKYNTNGVQQWVAHPVGLKNTHNLPAAMALDISGNVYVTGRAYDANTTYDYATVKYNPHGVEQWAVRYNGPGNYFDFPHAIAVDGLGNAYVAGSSYGIGTNEDYAIVKYNIDGVEEWVVRYNGSQNASDWATGIAVDNGGAVYVTGRIGGYDSGYITTIKYIQDENGSAPHTFNLSQSFPNPFTKLANIRFRLPSASFVTLKLYNLFGQEVETLIAATLSTGDYRVQWNPVNVPSGVYVYRLQAGGSSETKKLVLIR